MAKITDGRQLVITPSDPGPGGPTTPGVEAAAHVLYGSKHSRALRVTDNGGIDIAFEQGQIWVGGTFFSIGAGTLTLTDNATNYVFVNNAGAVADNTTGFPADSAPLAQVTTAAADISAVADRRAYLSAGAFGGGAILGNPFTVGDDDATHGEAWLYGDGAASTAGGALRLYTAADHDGTFHWWEMDVFEDDLRFFSSDNVVVNIMTAEGQLQLPIQGTGGGLLIGGEQIYRDSANSLTMPGGKLRLGKVNTLPGELYLYGAPSPSAEGGQISIELAEDEIAGAGFTTWNLDVQADDLRWFQSSGQLAMLFKGHATNPTIEIVNSLLVKSTVTVEGASLTVGLDDNTSGTLSLYGAAAGTEGGELRIYLTDAHDNNFDIWIIDVNADDLRFFQSSGQQVMRFRGHITAPNVLFPLTVYFDGNTFFKTQAAVAAAPGANYLRHFIFDGVGRVAVPTWVDENSDLYMATREVAVLVPSAVDASGGLVAGTAVSTTSAFVGLITVTAPINLDTITYNVALAGGHANNVIRIALYSEDGQTRLVDETDAVGVATGLRVVTLGADVLLPPGNYYAFMCYESGTGTGPTPTLQGTQAFFHTGGGSEPDLDGRLTVTAGAAPTTFDPNAITTPSASVVPYFRFDGA